MDSSRSGLLSTLIMTIPLIVVPALALLRPPAPDSGPSATRLDASSPDEDFFDEFAEITDVSDGSVANGALADGALADAARQPRSANSASRDSVPRTPLVEPADPFADMFPEPPVGRETPKPESAGSDPHAAANASPAASSSRSGSAALAEPASSAVAPPDRPLAEQRAATGGEADEALLLKQVRDLGATKTFWFAPGGEMTGFVAFLPGDNEHVSYRFEAICRSRVECLRQVHGQAARWRKSHRQSAGKSPSAPEVLKH